MVCGAVLNFNFQQIKSSGFGDVVGRNLPYPIALTFTYRTAYSPTRLCRTGCDPLV